MVTRPASEGGLGFDFKWDLGWMHDTLDYLDRDPVYRPHHQNELTFRALYAGNEHYIVPLSHDEVVHGKGSIVTKMSGDLWQKMANLRLLFGYQYTIPGKKLLFMGAEFAQWSEWNHEASLDWHLLQNVEHQGVLKWVRELNSLHRTTPALYRDDLNGGEFSWVSCDDAQRSILIWTRGSGDDQVLMLANFTPVPRDDYEVRVWSSGLWSVISNSDDLAYGGSGYMSVSGFHTTSADNGAQTLRVTMPPLSIIVLKRKV
jgi:1,4-alpha-glucan branching enzyme